MPRKSIYPKTRERDAKTRLTLLRHALEKYHTFDSTLQRDNNLQDVITNVGSPSGSFVEEVTIFYARKISTAAAAATNIITPLLPLLFCSRGSSPRPRPNASRKQTSTTWYVVIECPTHPANFARLFACPLQLKPCAKCTNKQQWAFCPAIWQIRRPLEYQQSIYYSWRYPFRCFRLHSLTT